MWNERGRDAHLSQFEYRVPDFLGDFCSCIGLRLPAASITCGLYISIFSWHNTVDPPLHRFHFLISLIVMLPSRIPRLHLLLQSKYLLRALGFELLNSICRRWSGSESPKPVIRRSRWIALSRCAIHLFPTVIILFLIALNFKIIYIGPGFSYRTSNGVYLVLFQIGAKTLEIACVASLTTVLLHVLRHDLLRDGVPLAFVGSGVFFTQVNFFWSPEMFIGALQSIKNWRRLRLLVLIIVAGALALLIAPSTAVLLQPRDQNVPAGGTAYFLPISPDELWPSEVNGSYELSECFGTYSAQNIVCASAGFDSLRSYFQNLNTSFANPLMMWDNYGLLPIIIESLAAKIPRLSSRGTVYGTSRETFRTQPNTVTATFQNALISDWRDGATRYSGSALSSMARLNYATQRLSNVVSTSPVVFTRCAPAQNITIGPGQINFPVKTWTPRKFIDLVTEGSPEWEDASKAFSVNIPENKATQSVQHQWIDLPTDDFGPVSGGILLQLPGNMPDTFQAVIGCSISAFWFSSQHTSDSLANEAAWSVAEVKTQTQWKRIRSDLNASNAESKRYRRLISIRDDWFRSLTPRTSCLSHSNQSDQLTTLQCLFSDVGLATVLGELRTQPQSRWNGTACLDRQPDPSETDVDRLNTSDCGNGGKHQLLEMMLASVFANGLSRYGSRHAFEQSSMSDSPTSPSRWLLKSLPRANNYYNSLLSNKAHDNAILPAPASADSQSINLRMHMEVVGYAWYANSFSDYIATTVVVVYLLVVLVHTVWVVTTGITSSSWDTVTELLGLALQSPPSQTLKGSGAGIERLGTYQRIVQLRARDEGQVQTVVLVVDDDEKNMNNRSRLLQTTTAQSTGTRYRKVEIDKEYI